MTHDGMPGSMPKTEAALHTRETIVRTLIATSFGFALVQLDVTVVNVALPRIGTELSTGTAGLQWVVDAYALTFAALLLGGGSLGDLFGSRRIYLGGLALFAVASLLCGLAGSAALLVAARALQGVGAAAMLPASLALLNHASGHDSKLRAWAVGWWTAAGAITIALGPIVGGLILGVASWRLIFLVNLPVCLVGAALAWRVPETIRGEFKRGLDPAGQVLSILALAGITGAVIEAKPQGFTSAPVLAMLAVGVASGIAFLWVERRARTPMMPLELFAAPGFAACVAFGMVVNFAYYGALFVLTLYLQHTLGYGAMATGFAYLPLTATFFVSNVLAGTLVSRFGARWPMVGGALVDALGFLLLLPLGAQAVYVAMLAPFALIPLGMGTGVPAMTTAVLASVAKERSGIAAAVLNAARQAAGAMGVAVFGALAGEGHEVSGLHASAGIAAVLLVAVALLAYWRVPAQA